MKKKILIIEDNINDFYEIKKLLDYCGYVTLPDRFEDMSKALDPYCKGDIVEFANHQIKDNYRDLRLVLCDITLGNDYQGGNKVVKSIRNCKDLNPSYISMLPIIAITNYPYRQERIINDGANLTLLKNYLFNNPIVVSSILETQMCTFEKKILQLNII